jgi:hypothetical protein
MIRPALTPIVLTGFDSLWRLVQFGHWGCKGQGGKESREENKGCESHGDVWICFEKLFGCILVFNLGLGLES